MTRPEEFEDRIQSLDWAGLRELWGALETRDLRDWPPGKAFEYLVLRAFQLDRAEVKWPYSIKGLLGNEIEQIDGAIHLGSQSFLIESKDHEANVAIGSIAKLRNQLLRRPTGTIGVVFSRTGFTNPARLLVQLTPPLNILLWNGDEMRHALEQEQISEFLLLKLRRGIELAIPDSDIRL